MDKKSFDERIVDWWDYKATLLQKFCVLFVLIVLTLLLFVFSVIMPVIWAIDAHKAAFLLIWILPIGACAAIGCLDDNGDIDLW